MTTIPHVCADCLEILGASTTWTPKGSSRPVWGLVYLLITTEIWLWNLKLYFSAMWSQDIVVGVVTRLRVGRPRKKG
jgi:hypothetical protein